MHRLLRPISIMLGCAVLLLAVGCAAPRPSLDEMATLKVGRVFLAQQHVLEPEHPYFKLLSDLDALLKVQVHSDTPLPAPQVVAVLELYGEREELALRGPDTLPPPYTGAPEMLPQRFDDSFTLRIPRRWIQPGLHLAIELRHHDYSSSNPAPGVTVLDRKEIGGLAIGAPNVVEMTLFDFNFFADGMTDDWPEGWQDELESKLPVSRLKVQRVSNVDLLPLVAPPRGEAPAILCHSAEEYEERAGMPFDGEQAMSLRWLRAIQRASGMPRYYRHHMATIGGVHAGGQAGGYLGVATIYRAGPMIHELGHSFGLPHWIGKRASNYPYKGDMFGVPASSPGSPHTGPPWAFDLKRMDFISPIIEEDRMMPERGKPGHWKRDPMLGGGMGDQESKYLYRHFSAYSMHRMRDYIERRAVKWNEKEDAYFGWDELTKRYSRPVEHREQALAENVDVPVHTILFCMSGATPEANHIYPPFGPYVAGYVKRFDATSAADRAAAVESGFVSDKVNLSLRVTQGGTTSTYLVRGQLNSEAKATDAASFGISALNLPAADGEITRVELLYTPDLIANGPGNTPETLATWSVPGSPGAR